MLLNTKDYGIPQNRERLFIIGILSSKMKAELQVPQHVKCKNILSYIDRTCTVREEYADCNKKKEHLFKDCIFMDVYNINIFESNKYSIDDENYESWNDKSINELKF